jgi:hypothetical protein
MFGEPVEEAPANRHAGRRARATLRRRGLGEARIADVRTHDDRVVLGLAAANRPNREDGTTRLCQFRSGGTPHLTCRKCE